MITTENFTILVLYDTELGNAVLSKHLAVSGYNSIYTQEESKVVELIMKHDVHLIIIDFFLDNAYSADIITKIREMRTSEQLRIILATHESNDMLIKECFKAGVDDFIPKPYNPEMLDKRIRSNVIELCKDYGKKLTRVLIIDSREKVAYGLLEELRPFPCTFKMIHTKQEFFKLSMKDYDLVFLEEKLLNTAIFGKLELIYHSHHFKILTISPLKEIQKFWMRVPKVISDYVIEQDFHDVHQKFHIYTNQLNTEEKKEEEHLGSKSILLIDESSQYKAILKSILKDMSYELFFAKTGNQGLDIMLNENIGLVFLDLHLTGMTGLDILHIIRNERSMYKIPIVVTSNRATKEDILDAFKLGATDFVRKPYTKLTIQKRLHYLEN